LKITRRMLRDMADAARQDLTWGTKDRHDSMEASLARCWAGAVVGVLIREGVAMDIEFERTPEVVEPLDG